MITNAYETCPLVSLPNGEARIILHIVWDFVGRRTLSSNILKVSQHEGAELFDGLPVAGRARETYP